MKGKAVIAGLGAGIVGALACGGATGGLMVLSILGLLGPTEYSQRDIQDIGGIIATVAIPMGLAGLVLFGAPAALVSQRQSDLEDHKPPPEQATRTAIMGCSYALVGFLISTWVVGAVLLWLISIGAESGAASDAAGNFTGALVISVPIGIVVGIVFGAIGALIAWILSRLEPAAPTTTPTPTIGGV